MHQSAAEVDHQAKNLHREAGAEYNDAVSSRTVAIGKRNMYGAELESGRWTESAKNHILAVRPLEACEPQQSVSASKT